MRSRLFLLLCGLLFLTCNSLQGQKDSIHDPASKLHGDTAAIPARGTGSKDCLQKDFLDLFRKKEPAPLVPEKRLSLLGIPYVGYSPSTGLSLGLAGTLGWYLGDPLKTKVSAGGASIEVTTKRQLKIVCKTTLYTNRNLFYLQGDFRIFLYSEPTYGLGTNSPDTSNYAANFGFEKANTVKTNGAFPMKYNLIKFYEIVSYRLDENLYLGVGYHLSYTYNIRDELLNVDTTPVQMTPHYYYCQAHHFNAVKYTTSGVSLNFVYDTRDNLINPYKGMYITINYLYNSKLLGSNQSSSLLWTEFRGYISLSKRKPRHLIALWAYTNFETSGEVPYLNLPAIGYDPGGRSGRGYDLGRYRGEDLAYGEVEYRFPISPCSQILGGVLFANVTTTSDRDRGIRLFEYMRPGFGAGIRIMVSKRFRTNVLIDFGVGFHSNGAYIQAQEAF
jgi:outer membrane protein assembly factor BamA